MKLPTFLLRPVLLTALLLSPLTGLAAAPDDEKPEFKPPPLKPITEKLPAAFSKKTPESVSDLKAIQEHVARMTEMVLPAVVCVRIGPTLGSGVIVSKDGYVLTAGHVSGKADRDVTVIFPGGKTAKGKTLGGNHGIDSGLIKITTEGEWPCVEMGDSAALKRGEWCMVCAHPGGYKLGRPPVLRLGRLLDRDDTTLHTDCILVGGDSGGPLFDMHGRVIGINSRIGNSVTANMHVPVNVYREAWDRLAKGEVFGGKLGGVPVKGGSWLGVRTEFKSDNCIVVEVIAGSPAEKAGLKADDVIRKFDGRDIDGLARLGRLVQQTRPGMQIVIEIQRGEQTIALRVEIGKREK
jgi:serine protease Do